jgi:hypothetical protein
LTQQNQLGCVYPAVHLVAGNVAAVDKGSSEASGLFASSHRAFLHSQSGTIQRVKKHAACAGCMLLRVHNPCCLPCAHYSSPGTTVIVDFQEGAIIRVRVWGPGDLEFPHGTAAGPPGLLSLSAVASPPRYRAYASPRVHPAPATDCRGRCRSSLALQWHCACRPAEQVHGTMPGGLHAAVNVLYRFANVLARSKRLPCVVVLSLPQVHCNGRRACVPCFRPGLSPFDPLMLRMWA